MKNKLSLFILICSLVCISSAQTTSNIGLNIPAHGTLNWDALMNANFNALDLFLSGNTALPALVVTGNVTAGGYQGGGSNPMVQIPPQGFAAGSSAHPCNSGAEGTMIAVNDSNTNTWGATVAAGGANHILAYCNGTNYTVMGK